jgi:hypothetical protein
MSRQTGKLKIPSDLKNKLNELFSARTGVPPPDIDSPYVMPNTDESMVMSIPPAPLAPPAPMAPSILGSMVADNSMTNSFMNSSNNNLQGSISMDSLKLLLESVKSTPQPPTIVQTNTQPSVIDTKIIELLDFLVKEHVDYHNKLKELSNQVQSVIPVPPSNANTSNNNQSNPTMLSIPVNHPDYLVVSSENERLPLASSQLEEKYNSNNYRENNNNMVLTNNIENNIFPTDENPFILNATHFPRMQNVPGTYQEVHNHLHNHFHFHSDDAKSFNDKPDYNQFMRKHFPNRHKKDVKNHIGFRMH